MSAPGLPFGEVVRLVARREVVERARERSFLLSTGFTLVILLGIVVVPQLLGFGDPPTYRVAFAAGTEQVREAARDAAEGAAVDLKVVEGAAGDVAAARARVADGDLDAVVTGERIVVAEDLPGDLAAVLQGASAQVRGVERLEAAGLDPAAVAEAQAVPPLAVEPLEPPDPGAATREAVAFVGTFVLYGQLLGYGFWVATGIVEEKSSRVVEVLLATVSPRALLAGKVLGIGLLALGQLLVLAVIALAAAAAVGAVPLSGDAVVPVLVVLGWFLLGFAFYACLFAAGAARVSRQEDLQAVTTPATTLVIASFLAALWVGNNPDSPVGRVLGVVPPLSALVSPVRTVGGEAAWWELALAVGLMLLAVAGLVVVAARVYEGSVLRMGGTVRWREAWRSRQAVR